jgi:hypothetical protein
MAAADNAELIRRFYAAFDAHDGTVMAACYDPDAHFEDPVFIDLNGDEPGQMWQMLTSRADDLSVELVGHEASDNVARAHWIARYTFTRTGRKVVNDVRARFRFTPEGLIADHRDHFSFHKWSRQALGTPGLLLGWTPFLQNKVRNQAREDLDRWMGTLP